MVKTVLWKVLEKPVPQAGKEWMSKLEERGYRPCDWNKNIFSRMSTPDKGLVWPIPCMRVSLGDLGFTGPTRLSEFYKKAREEGLENPPPLAAVLLRMVYDEQPVGEWLRIATAMDA